jgi:hypothetical protein
MCPACLTTLALIPVGAVSAGGVAAAIAQMMRGDRAAKDSVTQNPADISANK